MMGLTNVKQPLELCCCVFDKGIKKKNSNKKSQFSFTSMESRENMQQCVLLRTRGKWWWVGRIGGMWGMRGDVTERGGVWM